MYTQVHTHKITRIYSLIHKALPYHCLADFISEEEGYVPIFKVGKLNPEERGDLSRAEIEPKSLDQMGQLLHPSLP